MVGEDDAVWGGRNAKFANPDAKVWRERMGAKGWTAPMWPAEYGGGGLSNAENAVLQQEMKRFFKQLQLGRSRKKALLELADRSDLMEMRSFVTALIQQEELGTPLGKVMRMQGEIMRFRRIQVAEEKANKAPTQMLIPMILFIFPAIFLVLIGPMMIQAFRKVK